MHCFLPLAHTHLSGLWQSTRAVFLHTCARVDGLFPSTFEICLVVSLHLCGVLPFRGVCDFALLVLLLTYNKILTHTKKKTNETS